MSEVNDDGDLIKKLSAPQLRFVSTDQQFPLFVGGFGSGKTAAGIERATAKKFEYPENDVAYYLPTYDLIKKIAYPRFQAHFEEMHIKYKLNQTEHEIEVGPGWGKIIFRTMDKPERIIGYEVGDSIVDELDTLPTDKSADVWRRIISRNRQKKKDKKKNTVGVVTTPEGFKFVYNTWAEPGRKTTPDKGYLMIQAPTSSNAKFVPAEYEQSLRDAYPAQLCEAYLDGKFVNLTSGSVYRNFDRKLNSSRERIRPNETLHIGMDFNVTKMAAAVHVVRDEGETFHAVGELTDIFDTPAMIKTIIERYKSKGHPIIIYPDASGKARDSNNASETDFALLKKEFTLMVNSKNPLVRDRILATNMLMCGKDNLRRYYVNVQECPKLTQGYEKQVYDKNGEPDKSTGVDHIIDAGTYPIVYKFPIIKPVASTVSYDRIG